MWCRVVLLLLFALGVLAADFYGALGRECQLLKRL